MLFAKSPAAAAAGISYLGYSGGTTSFTPVTHAEDDYLIAFAQGSYYGSEIALPDGWTPIRRVLDGSRQTLLAYKVAASSGEESGTWTNASRVICPIYRGVSALGNDAYRFSSTSTTYWQSVSMSVPSWVVGFIYVTSYPSGIENPPTGMTNRAVYSSNIAFHDTASNVSSWSTQTTSIGSGWYVGDKYVYTLALR